MTAPDEHAETEPVVLERVFDGRAWLDVDAVTAWLLFQPEDPDDA